MALILAGFVTSGNLSGANRENLVAKLIYLGISIVFIFYYVFMLNNKDFKKYIVYVVIIELTFNAFLTFKNNGNENTYNELSYFSSVRNSKVFDYVNNVLGITVSDGCSAKYFYNNPVVNSLLGVKYVVSDNASYYEKIDDKLYLNKDATNLGFLTNKNLVDVSYNEDDFVNNFNKMIKTINRNSENIIEEITATEQTIFCNKTTNFCIYNADSNYMIYNYVAKKDEFIFINNDNFGKNEYEIYLNNESVNIDEIKIKVTLNDKCFDYKVHVYSVNYNVYKEFVKNINKNKMIIDNYYDDHHFTAKVNVNDENNLLYTSIAADNGWKVYVDGNLTDYVKINDAVIGLELENGEHLIEFKYSTPGLKEGLIISGISVLVSSIIILSRKKKINID